MKTNIWKKNGTTLLAAIAALAGMVIYIVTSVTGYLAASAANPWPIVCTIAAIVLFVAGILTTDKLSVVAHDVMTAGGFVLLLVSFYFFIMARVSLAADVYFIPVNYPASEATALHISVVGVVCYLVAAIILIARAFAKKEDN